MCLIFAGGCSNISERNTLVDDLKYGIEDRCNACVQEKEPEIEAKTKTYAQIEHECLEENYLEKQNELDILFQKTVSALKQMMKEGKQADVINKRLANLVESQKLFIEFVINYGKVHAQHYLRAYPYHHYGVMFELLNTRIKHIKILAAGMEIKTTSELDTKIAK